jgi:hypothetical protein
MSNYKGRAPNWPRRIEVLRLRKDGHSLREVGKMIFPSVTAPAVASMVNLSRRDAAAGTIPEQHRDKVVDLLS